MVHYLSLSLSLSIVWQIFTKTFPFIFPLFRCRFHGRPAVAEAIKHFVTSQWRYCNHSRKIYDDCRALIDPWADKLALVQNPQCRNCSNFCEKLDRSFNRKPKLNRLCLIFLCHWANCCWKWPNIEQALTTYYHSAFLCRIPDRRQRKKGWKETILVLDFLITSHKLLPSRRRWPLEVNIFKQ